MVFLRGLYGQSLCEGVLENIDCGDIITIIQVNARIERYAQSAIEFYAKMIDFPYFFE